MRKLIFALVLCMSVGLFATQARAQGFMNEPGSLLAFPLVDNINFSTIINIANTCNTDEVLECYIITHGPGGAIDEKKDFVIEFTGKEAFVWMTTNSYNQRGNQIQGFNGRKGYMFCFMIDDKYSQLEEGGDCFKGDAVLLSPTGSAFSYNAIPHQGLAVVGDRVLNLDGVEYSEATSQVMFEGLAEIPGAIGGTLAVASPGDIDFINSEQPEFDINVYCWNEVETKMSRHLPFKDFAQYDLTKDLQLDINQVFTLGWHCATTATQPLWAVFHQNLAGVFGWGGNVWQQPGTNVAATITLPPVPVQ